MNVYDPRDLVQSFFGKFDQQNINPLAPNTKRIIPNATNIKVKPIKGLYPESRVLQTGDEIPYHSVHTKDKWNNFVVPKLKGK